MLSWTYLLCFIHTAPLQTSVYKLGKGTTVTTVIIEPKTCELIVKTLKNEDFKNKVDTDTQSLDFLYFRYDV